MPDLSKYRFQRALRPFSFPVALIACLVGLVAAYAQGYWQPLPAVLVLIAGVLLQAGVNLINDYADLNLLPSQNRAFIAARQQIRRNFQLGLGCFVAAALLGFYLILQAGWPLLLIAVIGLLGALGYTLEPIQYKNRGLGVLLVFWLMGVLMITGSYLAVGAPFQTEILWLSLPISCLVSLLLLSNELRDYEQDRQDGLNTLTVRLGYTKGVQLYGALLFATAVFSALLYIWGLLTPAWPLLFLLFLLPQLYRLLRADSAARRALTPATARFLLLFGSLFCFLLLP